MRIAVYSITRDRLDYTKHCFASLREKAGQDFDHYIWDNHSEDGTKEWLLANLDDFAYVNLAASNYGIAQASNELIKVIKQRGPYDLIIKMDNDCEVVSDDILAKIAAWYAVPGRQGFILSPRVHGLRYQPQRVRTVLLGYFRLGEVEQIGGLFLVVPARVVYEN